MFKISQAYFAKQSQKNKTFFFFVPASHVSSEMPKNLARVHGHKEDPGGEETAG